MNSRRANRVSGATAVTVDVIADVIAVAVTVGAIVVGAVVVAGVTADRVEHTPGLPQRQSQELPKRPLPSHNLKRR